MTNRKRNALLGLFIVLFLIVSGFSFFYSQGWRLNLKTFTAVKVGAVYLRTFPKDASIEIDGKPMKNASWLFQNGTLFNNLFPKEYHIRITHEGYRDWNRTILVAPAYVAEVKYAVLVPQEATPLSDTTSTATQVWPAGGEGNFISQDTHGILRYGLHQIPGDTILEESHDRSNVLTRDEKTSSDYLFETANGSSTNLSNLVKKHGIRAEYSCTFNATDSNEVVIASAEMIGRYSVREHSLTFLPIPASISGDAQYTRIASVSASSAHIAFAMFEPRRNISHIMRFDAFLNRMSTEDILIPGKTLVTKFTASDQLALLQDDGSFYLVSWARGTQQKIASDAVSFVATSDGNRFAVLERKSLEIFSLQEKMDYRRFRLSEEGGIARLVWYQDGQHLFLYYPNQVAFLDVDDIRLEDVPVVSKDRNAVYRSDDNSLYETHGGIPRQVKFPD